VKWVQVSWYIKFHKNLLRYSKADGRGEAEQARRYADEQTGWRSHKLTFFYQNNKNGLKI
jgi:hypothetical protein